MFHHHQLFDAIYVHGTMGLLAEFSRDGASIMQMAYCSDRASESIIGQLTRTCQLIGADPSTLWRHPIGPTTGTAYFPHLPARGCGAQVPSLRVPQGSGPFERSRLTIPNVADYKSRRDSSAQLCCFDP